MLEKNALWGPSFSTHPWQPNISWEMASLVTKLVAELFISVSRRCSVNTEVQKEVVCPFCATVSTSNEKLHIESILARSPNREPSAFFFLENSISRLKHLRQTFPGSHLVINLALRVWSLPLSDGNSVPTEAGVWHSPSVQERSTWTPPRHPAPLGQCTARWCHPRRSLCWRRPRWLLMEGHWELGASRKN